MKQVSIYLLSFLAAISVYAHQNMDGSAVTITVNGNKTLQLYVDGKDYNLISNLVNGNKTTITINNLELGQHTLLFTGTGQKMDRAGSITTTFNLRHKFDMLIKLNGNGSLELIETKKTGIPEGNVPMSSADYNYLLRNVKSKRTNNERKTVIAGAFSIANNYFTTYQVSQLLRLVNSENYRLDMAKLSYKTITDRQNFNQLYDILNNQASRNELEDYVNNYDDDSDLQVAMSDVNFNSLYKTIKQQWPVSTQTNSLANAFSNTNNFFTAYQASQLIQIVSTENNRLQIAKLSYRSITDRNNFSQIYNLLNNQTSKNELSAFVNNFNGVNNPNIAMSDENFNIFYQTISGQYFPGEQLSSLTSAFNNTGNFFTTSQVKQLIPLVSYENNRLQLAKLSYRTIVDRENFSQLYDLLSNKSSRDELDMYIKTYQD